MLMDMDMDMRIIQKRFRQAVRAVPPVGRLQMTIEPIACPDT